MSEPILREVALDGDITERPLTNDEISVFEQLRTERLAKEKQEQDKLKARIVLFERLGITEEEAKLLLS